jgi:hypothetical protein
VFLRKPEVILILRVLVSVFLLQHDETRMLHVYRNYASMQVEISSFLCRWR